MAGFLLVDLKGHAGGGGEEGWVGGMRWSDYGCWVWVGEGC